MSSVRAGILDDPLTSARQGQDDESGPATRHLLARVRQLILSGDAAPGSPIRQTQLATDLGVSRVPLREVLSALVAEGLLQHTPHVGFTVTRLSSHELTQVYAMRRLLETELVQGIPDLPDGTLERMVALNHDLESCIDTPDVQPFVERNRLFHYALFDLSPDLLILAEVKRMWLLSDFYRSLHLHGADRRRRAVIHNREVLVAAGAGNVRLIARILERNRMESQRHLAEIMATHARLGGRP